MWRLLQWQVECGEEGGSGRDGTSSSVRGFAAETRLSFLWASQKTGPRCPLSSELWLPWQTWEAHGAVQLSALLLTEDGLTPEEPLAFPPVGHGLLLNKQNPQRPWKSLLPALWEERVCGEHWVARRSPGQASPSRLRSREKRGSVPRHCSN